MPGLVAPPIYSGGFWSLAAYRWAPLAWTVVLGVLALGPALLPGYVLSYDMVFTPEQSLLPSVFGIDSGLPRAVPQDPLVGFIAGPIPGQLVQKLALLGALVLAGMGANRVLSTTPLLVRLAAITLMIWNPFVAERLVIGHWALLVAYGATPWVLVQVASMRRGEQGAWVRVIATTSLGSLVPSGALLMVVLILPALFYRSVARGWERVAAATALVLFTSTWWVAAVLNPNISRLDEAGTSAFALRPENWAGVLGAALAGAGTWNAEVVPASRALPWIPVVGLVLVVLALFGRRRLGQVLDRSVANWLLVIAGIGFCWALLASWQVSQPMMSSLMEWIPGGGILRDGQKLLLPLVVFSALAAPLGLVDVLERVSVLRRIKHVALAALLVAPIAVLPDMALGGFGKLSAVSYSPSWADLRERVEQSPAGDAISLPWTPFRRYDWNADRTVLDPMPRYVPITVLTDDRLPVATSGGLVLIDGDNPRSAQVTTALASGEKLSILLPGLGVRYVIEQTDQPQQLDPQQFAGLELIEQYPGLRLWAVTSPIADTRSEAGLTLLVILNSLSLALAIGGWTVLGIGRYRTRTRHVRQTHEVGTEPSEEANQE
jgi:hypothetical protein